MTLEWYLCRHFFTTTVVCSHEYVKEDTSLMTSNFLHTCHTTSIAHQRKIGMTLPSLSKIRILEYTLLVEMTLLFIPSKLTYEICINIEFYSQPRQSHIITTPSYILYQTTPNDRRYSEWYICKALDDRGTPVVWFVPIWKWGDSYWFGTSHITINFIAMEMMREPEIQQTFVYSVLFLWEEHCDNKKFAITIWEIQNDTKRLYEAYQSTTFCNRWKVSALHQYTIIK